MERCLYKNKKTKQTSIYSNAHALARYRHWHKSVEWYLLVEPEVLMDGDHSADDLFLKNMRNNKKMF